MASKFEQEISQMGDKLIEHMIRMFMKYCVKQDQQQPDEDEQEDEAENAAIAALATIREILKTGLVSHMYFQLSGNLIELFLYILDNDLDYISDMIEVFAALMYKAERISDYVFLYLAFRKMLEGGLHPTTLSCPRIDIIRSLEQVYEEIDELLSILKNLMRQMPAEVLNGYPLPSNPGLLLCLVENKLIKP
jgi:hypothetical protein